MKLLRTSIGYGVLAMSALACSPEAETTFVEQAETGAVQHYEIAGKKATVYTTASNTEWRLSKTDEQSFSGTPQPREPEISVFVNPHKTFQTFLGIGGAITDASAETLAKLPPEVQEEIIKAYYDPVDGIGYSLGRTNIHRCDFSSGSYTYVEEGDAALKTFSIEHDRAYKLPMIKRAIAAAGGSMTFYASPWSPPAFMKDTKNMLQGGKLLPEYNDAWALYYTKFIKAYEAEGVPIWGITIQNEPLAKQTWESCIYTAEEERDLLKNHLGPIMEREGLGDKNIVVWDHNRDLMTQRANVILNDPEAAKYVWGVGFHWYETWTGAEPLFKNVDVVNDAFPDKHLLFTEGCQERFDASQYQNFTTAERYGRSMINDFNNGTEGWTDWNVLLDQHGGPNHVGNFCFSPIHGDTEQGIAIYTPSYYYIGHFSKFIRPNSKRVSTSTSRSTLEATSFLNASGSLVTVVMNGTDEDIHYKLLIDQEAIEVRIPAHGMQTVITE